VQLHEVNGSCTKRLGDLERVSQLLNRISKTPPAMNAHYIDPGPNLNQQGVWIKEAVTVGRSSLG
jgi:hypothetical protein